MNSESDKELAGVIAGLASDPATRRQLRRLPAFAVPEDSESVFRSLLNKLEAAMGNGDPATDTRRT